MTVIGTVELRDWDEGCMKTLGAEIVSYVVDGDTRQVYAVDVPGIQSGIAAINNLVPAHFHDGEDNYQNYILPCFEFRQNDLTPAWDRHPWYGWVGRQPSKDAVKITLADGTVGYSKYDNQWRAEQFDITYELIVKARRRQELLIMLTYALRIFKSPSFIFKLVDSLGELREYDAVDVSVSNASELVDIAERIVAYTISFTVRGEVDLCDDRVFNAATDISIAYNKYETSEISDVNQE